MRPSERQAALSAEAAKLSGAGEQFRLVIEAPKAARTSIRIRAAQSGKTIRAYVLGLLAADGVEGIGPDDLK